MHKITRESLSFGHRKTKLFAKENKYFGGVCNVNSVDQPKIFARCYNVRNIARRTLLCAMGQENLCARVDRRQEGEHDYGSSEHVARALCLNDAPRDCSLEVTFGLGVFNVRITFRQGKREILIHRPYVNRSFFYAQADVIVRWHMYI